MSRELMKQALDALDNHNGNYKLTVAECKAINKVCDNLRQALAQPDVPLIGEGKTKQEPVCDKDPSLCGATLCQLAKVCKHTPRNTIPTKIVGPNAAGFYKREWVGLSVNEARDFFESKLTRSELITEISEFLEEKNNAV